MSQVCFEIKEWVEEEIEQPVEEWVEQTEERCRDYPWWDPRGWVCWLVTTLVKVVTWVIVTVGKWVVTVICIVVTVILEVIELTVGFILDLVAFVLDVIFSIPILGRLLQQLWNIILEIVWRLVGLFDAFLGLIGIRVEKKLRVCVVILRDENNNPVATEADVIPQLQRAIDIFDTEANVRIVPTKHPRFVFNDNSETASSEYIHINSTHSPTRLLDLDCDAKGWLKDFGLVGTDFGILRGNNCFWGGFRRLIGFGSPITIFVIRSVPGTSLGCSMGPLTDYITIEGGNPVCMAHELGHACGLWHVSDNTNLMHANGCANNNLNWGQEVIIRNSRHVSYL